MQFWRTDNILFKRCNDVTILRVLKIIKVLGRNLTEANCELSLEITEKRITI